MPWLSCAKLVVLAITPMFIFIFVFVCQFPFTQLYGMLWPSFNRHAYTVSMLSFFSLISFVKLTGQKLRPLRCRYGWRGGMNLTGNNNNYVSIRDSIFHFMYNIHIFYQCLYFWSCYFYQLYSIFPWHGIYNMNGK